MKNKKTAVVAVLVAVGIATLGLAAAVYAKYVSTITRTGSAKVAKWAFTSDNGATGTISCDPENTYNANTLVSGKIAPGTTGTCPIVISNANTEVGVDYTIALPSTIAGKPTNLKFYDNSGTEVTSAAPITGHLNPGAGDTTINVKWEWPYEDGTTAYDTADTTDGAAAASLSIEFTITGTQTEPTH